MYVFSLSNKEKAQNVEHRNERAVLAIPVATSIKKKLKALSIETHP